MDNRTKERKPPDKGRVKMKPPDGLKAMPKELALGAIQDGILGDWSILATKAVLDFIIIMVMTCSLGKGCGFSAIPVLLFEGLITVFASLLKPVMTDLAMNYLSLISSILIFCIGLNLAWGKRSGLPTCFRRLYLLL